MAILGISLDRNNPEFFYNDFIFWMPQFKNSVDENMFLKLRDIANNKIYKSIWGSDWEYAMSLCIAHYLELIASNLRSPESDNLASVSGGGSYKGVTTSMSIGGYSKSIDLSSVQLKDKEALFWNQTAYGSALMSLYKTKSIPSIFVVTKDY